MEAGFGAMVIQSSGCMTSGIHGAPNVFCGLMQLEGKVMESRPIRESARDATVGMWTEIDQTPEPESFIRFMDAFNATAWLQAHKRRTLSLLDAREGFHLLNVGCGTGDDACLAARQVGSSGKVVGIDPSATMITKAKERSAKSALSVEFQQSSVYELPFPDSTFNGTYSFLTFDVLERPKDALRELLRVVKPGGRVAISAPDHDTLIVDAPDRGLTRKLRQCFCDDITNGWMGRQLHGLCVAAGLQAITITPDTLTLTSADYAFATRILDRIVARARAAGVVTSDEAARWLASVDEANRAGRFFYAGTCFIVSGRKP